MSVTQLVKGQNAPLPDGPVSITAAIGAPANLSALLVTAAGRVRTDADFVFFNQPDAPGVRCRQDGAGWRIEIDPTRLPPEIDQVRVVADLESPGARFGALTPPVVSVVDAAGTAQVGYQVTGLDTESIVILVEVYRRGGAFKVRAVGQGYAGGLADLITAHGVSVDDPGPTPAPVSPVSPTAQFPAPSAFPAPLPPAFPAPPAAAAAGWPAPTGGAPAPLPPPVPAPNSPPANPPGEVSLVKGKSVSLQKGQRVSLRKEDGGGLAFLRMGLGWDPLTRRSLFGRRDPEIDLDASAVLFAAGQPVEVVFYNNLKARDGSVEHLGDNRTGAGDGDDETVLIDLRRIAAQVRAIVLIVTSYEGQSFEQVANAFCRLVDHTNGTELARFTLAGGMPFTGVVMAIVYRDGAGWKFAAIGEGIQARTPGDAVPQLARFVR